MTEVKSDVHSLQKDMTEVKDNVRKLVMIVPTQDADRHPPIKRKLAVNR
jgi:hypothetical protein